MLLDLKKNSMENENELEQDSLKDLQEDETSKNEEEQNEKDYKTLYENQRIRAEKAEKKLKESSSKKETTSNPQEDVNQLKQELEELKLNQVVGEVSEEIKKEIKDYAKIKGISYAEAKNSSYIQFAIDKETQTRNEEDASISSKGGVVHKDYSKMKISDFDLSTDEGQKSYQAYKKANGMI